MLDGICTISLCMPVILAAASQHTNKKPVPLLTILTVVLATVSSLVTFPAGIPKGGRLPSRIRWNYLMLAASVWIACAEGLHTAFTSEWKTETAMHGISRLLNVTLLSAFSIAMWRPMRCSPWTLVRLLLAGCGFGFIVCNVTLRLLTLGDPTIKFTPGYTTFPNSLLVGTSFTLSVLLTAERVRQMQSFAYNTLSLSHLQSTDFEQLTERHFATAAPSAPSVAMMSSSSVTGSTASGVVPCAISDVVQDAQPALGGRHRRSTSEPRRMRDCDDAASVSVPSIATIDFDESGAVAESMADAPDQGGAHLHEEMWRSRLLRSAFCVLLVGYYVSLLLSAQPSGATGTALTNDLAG